MCRSCWHNVPAPLQRAVYRTWRALRDFRGNGDLRAIRADYDRATEAAISAAEKAR
jgi:hypothetical protein